MCLSTFGFISSNISYFVAKAHLNQISHDNLQNEHMAYTLNSMRYFILPCIIVLIYSLPAQAAEKRSAVTTVSLSSEATKNITHDEVVMDILVETRGQNTKKMRNQVNRISLQISQRMEREQSVTLATTNRRTDPVYEKGLYPQQRVAWVVSQSIRITSTDLDALPTWLDAIEKIGAKLQGLRFKISNTLRQDTENSLRMQAIKNFRRKAATVAQALSAKSFKILHLQTDETRPLYTVQRTHAIPMLSDATNTPPSMHAGKSRITISVNGEIEIAKKSFAVK